MSKSGSTPNGKRGLEARDALNHAKEEQPKKRAKLTAGASFADVLRKFQENEAGDEGMEWQRPDIQNLNAMVSKSIVVQCLDIRPAIGDNGESEIQLFGVTEGGHTVMAHVLGFTPRVEIPVVRHINQNHLSKLHNALKNNKRLQIYGKNVVLLPNIELRSIEGREDDPDVRIEVSDFRCAPTVREIATAWLKSQNLLRLRQGARSIGDDYDTQFTLDTEISSMTWVKLHREKFAVVSNHRRCSRCQLEVKILYEDISIITRERTHAPLRILSFDIETDIAEDLGRFVNAEQQPVIQIGNMVADLGSLDQPPFIRTIFTLDTCEAIEGTQVIVCKTEVELLKRWQAFIHEVDPDIVTGFNIKRFDIPFLIRRARVLSLDSFAFLGRLTGLSQKLPSEVNFENSPILEGRVIVDMMMNSWDQSGTGRNLEKVSNDVLHEGKEQIKFTMIPELQHGDASTRRELAVYCMKDTYLPLRLFRKLNALAFEIKRAAEAQTTINKYHSSPAFRALKPSTSIIQVPR